MANTLEGRLLGLSAEQMDTLRSGSEEGKAVLKALLLDSNDVDVNDVQSLTTAMNRIMAKLDGGIPGMGTLIKPEAAGARAAMLTAAVVEAAAERGADVSSATQVATNVVTSAFITNQANLASQLANDLYAPRRPSTEDVLKAVAAGVASGAVTAAANANLSADVVANVAQAASAGVVSSIGTSAYSSFAQSMAASATQGAVNAASQTGQNVGAIAQSFTQGAAQGAANAGLSATAVNAVVLSAATSATQTASAAGVTVTITDVTVEAPASSQAPVIITDSRPEVPDAPDNLVQTLNFTIVTINVAGQNVALSLTSAITDAVAVALSGNTVVGTQITSGNRTFDLSAIATAVGAPLTQAQLNHLAEVIARALNVDIIASGSNSIIVSPSS